MKHSVRKAIMPVAGLGTRFLPVTKSIPKELLPIVDKPLVQYAVEEALVAGITEIIFITHPSKMFIEEYFGKSELLEQELINKNKLDLLDSINKLINADIKYTSVIQEQPLGLGHAVLCAKELVGG